HPRRAPNARTEFAANAVGEVDLTAFECSQARDLVRHGLEYQALHARRLAPVALGRLEHQLHPRREGDEAIGPRADRRLLEAVLAHVLDVVPGDHPARARRQRAVEAHEVWPGLLEAKAD